MYGVSEEEATDLLASGRVKELFEKASCSQGTRHWIAAAHPRRFQSAASLVSDELGGGAFVDRTVLSSGFQHMAQCLHCLDHFWMQAHVMTVSKADVVSTC